ncbi:MAG: COQ9 family protein [Alphaproteobacteria bacterium]|nr:COQ9 family protein [Alphaproteobacteria bacterium]
MADTDGNPVDALRERILSAALLHVAFDGWSARSLRAGAEDAGADAAHLMMAFPGGVDDAIALFVARADREMTAALEARDLSGLKVRERVALAIRLRLEQAEAHKEAVRLALAHWALPHNAPRALASLCRTVDAIWWTIGDTSVDFNYYTKRGLLAGVYAATLLYWLDDRSDGNAATWAFLDRRIAEVLRVGRSAGDLVRRLSAIDPFAVLRGLRERGAFRAR